MFPHQFKTCTSQVLYQIHSVSSEQPSQHEGHVLQYYNMQKQKLSGIIAKYKKLLEQGIRKVAMPIGGLQQQSDIAFYAIYNLQKYLNIIYMNVSLVHWRNPYSPYQKQQILTFQQAFHVLFLVFKLLQIYGGTQTELLGQTEKCAQKIDEILKINTQGTRKLIDKNKIFNFIKDASGDSYKDFSYLRQFSSFLMLLAIEMRTMTIKQVTITYAKVLIRLENINVLLDNKFQGTQIYKLANKNKYTGNDEIMNIIQIYYRMYCQVTVVLIRDMIFLYQTYGTNLKNNLFLQQYSSMGFQNFFRDRRMVQQALGQMSSLQSTGGPIVTGVQAIKVTQPQSVRIQNKLLVSLQNSIVLYKLKTFDKKFLSNFKQNLQLVDQFTSKTDEYIKYFEEKHVNNKKVYDDAIQSAVHLFRLGKIILPQRLDFNQGTLKFGQSKADIAYYLGKLVNARVRCQHLDKQEYNSINYICQQIKQGQFTEKVVYMWYQHLIGLEDSSQKKMLDQNVEIKSCYEKVYQNAVQQLRGSQQIYAQVINTKLSLQISSLPVNILELQTFMELNWDKIMEQYNLKRGQSPSLIKIIVSQLLKQYSSLRGYDYQKIINSPQLTDLIQSVFAQSDEIVKNQTISDVNSVKRQIEQIIHLTVLTNPPVNLQQQENKQILTKYELKKQTAEQLRSFVKKKEGLYRLMERWRVSQGYAQSNILKKINEKLQQIYLIPQQNGIQLNQLKDMQQNLKDLIQKSNQKIKELERQRQNFININYDKMMKSTQMKQENQMLAEKDAKMKESQFLQVEKTQQYLDFIQSLSQNKIFTPKQSQKLQKILQNLLKIHSQPLQAIKSLFTFMTQIGDSQKMIEKLRKLAYGNIKQFTQTEINQDRELSQAFTNRFMSVFQQADLWREIKIISSRYHSNEFLIKFFINKGRATEASGLQTQNILIREWMEKIEKVYKQFIKDVFAPSKVIDNLEDQHILQLKNPKQYFLRILNQPKKKNSTTSVLMSKLSDLSLDLKKTVDEWNKKQANVVWNSSKFIDQLYKQADAFLQANQQSGEGDAFYNLMKQKLLTSLSKMKGQLELKKQIQKQKKYADCITDFFIQSFVSMGKTNQIIGQLIDLVPSFKSVSNGKTYYQGLKNVFNKNIMKHAYNLIKCRVSSGYDDAKEVIQKTIAQIPEQVSPNLKAQVMKTLQIIKKIDSLSNEQFLKRYESDDLFLK